MLCPIKAQERAELERLVGQYKGRIEILPGFTPKPRPTTTQAHQAMTRSDKKRATSQHREEKAQRQAQLFELYKRGASAVEAAKATGLSRHTVYGWYKIYKEKHD